MLRQAVVSGDIETVRSLLAKGVDVNDTEGSEHGTPLHAAARKGQLEIVTLLMDAGASIDFRDEDMGATPLMVAVDAGQVDVVKRLIERGASINATNTDGASALLYAQGAPAVVRDELTRLLRKGRGQEVASIAPGWSAKSPRASLESTPPWAPLRSHVQVHRYGRVI